MESDIKIYTEYIQGESLQRLAHKYEKSEAEVLSVIKAVRKGFPDIDVHDLVKDMVFRAKLEINYIRELREQMLKGLDESTNKVRTDAEGNVTSIETGEHLKVFPGTAAALTRELREYEKFLALLQGLLGRDDSDIHDLFAALLKDAKSPRDWKLTRADKGRLN